MTSQSRVRGQRVLDMALIGVLAMSLGVVSLAQDDTAPPEDLGGYQSLVDSGLFPTAGHVERARSAAMAAFSGPCVDALPLIDEWISLANWHSNLIAAGLQPFYGAASSDRSAWFGRQTAARRAVLIDLERRANDYRGQRNLGFVMRAECLFEMGQPLEALATFARVLDLIDIDDDALWMRAQAGLYGLIEIPGP